jgi:hypothetical protein
MKRIFDNSNGNKDKEQDSDKKTGRAQGGQGRCFPQVCDQGKS